MKISLAGRRHRPKLAHPVSSNQDPFRQPKSQTGCRSQGPSRAKVPENRIIALPQGASEVIGRAVFTLISTCPTRCQSQVLGLRTNPDLETHLWFAFPETLDLTPETGRVTFFLIPWPSRLLTRSSPIGRRIRAASPRLPAKRTPLSTGTPATTISAGKIRGRSRAHRNRGQIHPLGQDQS